MAAADSLRQRRPRFRSNVTPRRDEGSGRSQNDPGPRRCPRAKGDRAVPRAFPSGPWSPARPAYQRRRPQEPEARPRAPPLSAFERGSDLRVNGGEIPGQRGGAKAGQWREEGSRCEGARSNSFRQKTRRLILGATVTGPHEPRCLRSVLICCVVHSVPSALTGPRERIQL